MAIPAARLREVLASAQAVHRQGRLAEAEAAYQAILNAQPSHADALHMLGLIALQTGRPERGVALIGKAVARRPDSAEAHSNLGLGYADLGRYQDALTHYAKALRLKPNFPEVLDNRGSALRSLGRLDEAIASYDKAIALRPDFAAALGNRAGALFELGRFQAALDSLDQALRCNPGDPVAHCDRGAVLQRLGRLPEALDSLSQAVGLHAGYAEAWNHRGTVLHDLNRDAEALDSFAKAIALNPAYPEAHYNLGNALLALRHYEDALNSYGRAIAARPAYVEAHYNSGNALMGLQQPGAAIIAFDQATALAPGHAEAWYNRGNALMAVQRHDDALDSFRRAIALKPGHADAHACLGMALHALRRYQEALDSYDHAVALAPDTPLLLGNRLLTRRQICLWQPEDALIPAIASGLDAAPPFPVLAYADVPAIHRKAAETYARVRFGDLEPLPAAVRSPGDRIRIGYFSADYRDHAMMHLLIDLFPAHNRSRFEVVAFSMGADSQDAMRQRAVRGVDRFLDVRGVSDRDAARLAREIGIDIAVDLMGFTQGARTGIFAHRAAPVQVNFLGYPGTVGADFIDYIVVDPVTLGAPDAFTEKTICLPDTYQVNEANRPVSDRVGSRGEHGLPPDGFVFACFNNSFKITPAVFGRWMRILRRVPGSVLWLLDENPDAAGNLRREAAARGIAPDRLVFAPRVPVPDHLARQRLAGLFLDTLPYNAHTTASDALWAGLPVLTLMGESFPARVAASLLTAVGLPELIVTTPEAYETLAVALAGQPDRLNEIKARLVANRTTAALFDPVTFTRHLEAAFTAIHQRHRAGLPPAAVEVARSGVCVVR